jgi:hypothetical protein
MHIRLEYAEFSNVYHAISAEVPLTTQIKLHVLLTVHLVIIFVNNQPDAQFFFMYISILSMFRAAMYPSSGELILSMSLIQTCTPNGDLYRVTYTKCHIDTLPDHS